MTQLSNILPVALSFSQRTQCKILIFISLFTLHPSLLSNPLNLSVSHDFNSEPIQTSNWHRNSAGELLTLTRLSYFLSDLQFVTSTGVAFQPPNSLHYIDAFAPETSPATLDIPTGTYTSLRFNIGLSPELNHSDPNQYPPSHPLSTLKNAMHWSWSSGYIFAALEGYATNPASDNPTGFSYHIANDALLTPVEIPINFSNTAAQTQQLTLTLDLATVLSGADFSLLAQTSTHSRPGDPIAHFISTRLATAFTAQLSHTSSPTPPSPPQTTVPQIGTPYPFTLPKNFPIPILPTDFPLTEERVALGEALFNSTDLSRNNTLSCISCHSEENAFSDPRKFSVGFDGALGRRQSMPLLNLAWKSSFFWDGRAASLREQALHPIQDPTEMGADIEQVISRLQNSPTLSAQFQSAFGDPKITAERIGIALENFLLTLTSYDSKLDSAIAGKSELTAQEKRGFELFMTEYDPRRGQYGADCFHCHGTATFSDSLFHNNGLGQASDRGLAEFTQQESDAYKFATPSLRNIALTAPYMHDGRFNTLAEVVAHYNSGIQNSATLDPNLAKHPATGLALTTEDQAALVAFLESLTDPRFEN